MTKRKIEPDVLASDNSCMSYSAARTAWENGDFSEWVEAHGWPLTIAEEKFVNWKGVEDALSDDSWD